MEPPEQTPDQRNAPAKAGRPAPVERDFDMRIAADGRWYHEGGLIKRDGLVKLFASVLEVDKTGQHWLRTPVEFGRIEVEDAPFIIISVRAEGSGATRNLTLTDNLDRDHLLGPDRPLVFRPHPDTHSDANSGDQSDIDTDTDSGDHSGDHSGAGDTRPYLQLDGGLLARLSRPAWYELAEMADDENAAGAPGLWSAGRFFVLV